MGQGACGEAGVLGRVTLGRAALLGLEPAFCSFLALDKVLDILGVGEEPQRDTLQSSLKLLNTLLFWSSWTHQASFRFRIHEEPAWMVAGYPRAR